MECPVCMRSLKKREYIFPCKHELCNKCYKKIKIKCPICRCDMESLCDERLDSYNYITVKTTKKDKIISLKNLKNM